MKSMLDQIARDGWSTASDFFPLDEIARLRAIWDEQAGKARPASIAKARRLDPGVRGDSILWLDDAGLTTNDPFLARLHQFRKLANETLFLNLHNFEAHFANYPPGAGYDAHFDQPRLIGQTESARVLSSVTYLNPQWNESDGGELILWQDVHKKARLATILPKAGTLVLFRSDLIFHEVRPARIPRLSIAGWFRREQPLHFS